jgi:two-component system sensor histidine kinase EvgS
MEIDTGTAETKSALNLLNEARAEADRLRTRLKVLNQVILSSRLVMGHEIKKPTTALSGYLDLAVEELERGTGKEVENSLRKARSECDLLNDLNLFFLELLKIDNGEEVLRGSKINLRDSVFEVLDHLPADLSVKERVTTRISPNIRDFRINPDAFKVILSNVIENALKYSPAESNVLVDVRRDPEKRRMRDQELLKIKVVDCGFGIPDVNLKRIFAPFVRLHDGVTEGSGLGLTLVRSLVELYGGDVHIKSSRDDGTTVHVTIPEIVESAESEPKA